MELLQNHTDEILLGQSDSLDKGHNLDKEILMRVAGRKPNSGNALRSDQLPRYRKQLPPDRLKRTTAVGFGKTKAVDMTSTFISSYLNRHITLSSAV